MKHAAENNTIYREVVVFKKQGSQAAGQRILVRAVDFVDKRDDGASLFPIFADTPWMHEDACGELRGERFSGSERIAFSKTMEAEKNLRAQGLLKAIQPNDRNQILRLFHQDRLSFSRDFDGETCCAIRFIQKYREQGSIHRIQEIGRDAPKQVGAHELPGHNEPVGFARTAVPNLFDHSFQKRQMVTRDDYHAFAWIRRVNSGCRCTEDRAGGTVFFHQFVDEDSFSASSNKINQSMGLKCKML